MSFSCLPDRLGQLLFGPRSAAWILPLLRPYYRPVIWLAGFTLITALLGLLAPWLTRLVIDEALLKRDFPALVDYSLALFAVGLLALLSGVLNSYLHLRFSVRMLNEVRSFLLRCLLQLSPRQHARLQVGEVMSRLDGDASELQQFAFDSLLAGGGAVVRLFGSIAFMLWLNWQLTLLVAVLVPLEWLFLSRVRPGTEQRAAEVRSERGRLAALLSESVLGIPVLQGLRAEGQRTASVQDAQQSMAQALLRQRLWSESVNLFPALLSALGRMAILLLGGYWVIQGQMGLGSLIAFLSYLGFLLGPMRTLLGLYHAQARVKAAVARLDMIALQQPDLPQRTDAALPDPQPGALSLQQVSVEVGGRRVLDQVSLELPAGSKVLLRGASGGGKSTLCAVLAGYLQPQQGEVQYQGRALEQLQLAGIRQALLLLPQNGFLFHGSLLDHFRLADPTVSEARIWQVLGWVQLDGWAREVGGLERRLGERGLDLSGGQRQRLCLARALLLPFQVLLLDESLSEVDPQSARAIVACLDREFPHTTRIWVAHGHEDIFLPCDRVLTLEQGRLT
ncbi:MAG: ABC transporter ATP-binding protein [Thiolinea sp.]